MHNGHKQVSPWISFHKPSAQQVQFGMVLELLYPRLQDKDTHLLGRRNFLAAHKCNLWQKGFQGADASAETAILPDIGLPRSCHAQTPLMYLLIIAYARASIKKGPNSTIDQRGNLPTEFFPKIQGRLMALWDAIVTMKATKLVARKGSTTILMPIWPSGTN